MEELETSPEDATGQSVEADADASSTAQPAEATVSMDEVLSSGESPEAPDPPADASSTAQPAEAPVSMEDAPGQSVEADAGDTSTAPPAEATVSMDEVLSSGESPETVEPPVSMEDTQLRAVLEAIVYVAEDPLTLPQIAAALQQPPEKVRELMGQLVEEFEKPHHGVTIREVAGGYKMATKAEHHDAVRSFVKSLKPPLKLSLPALETLAVIAYKQPVTSPEIQEVRGVRGASVLNTLLDRKLIAAAGRKNVIGKPILYKTTKEFLIQFGLKDLSELPSLKEFEEIRRMAFSDSDDSPATEAPAPEPVAAAEPEPEPQPAEPEET